MRSEASWGLKLAALGGLLFLHLPILLIFLYAFTTDLFVKSYIQWNNLEDKFSANFLLGWEYRPGSEIYLVYNEIHDRFESPDLAPRDRMLLLKWTYNLRF